MIQSFVSNLQRTSINLLFSKIRYRLTIVMFTFNFLFLCCNVPSNSLTRSLFLTVPLSPHSKQNRVIFQVSSMCPKNLIIRHFQHLLRICDHGSALTHMTLNKIEDFTALLKGCQLKEINPSWNLSQERASRQLAAPAPNVLRYQFLTVQ